MNTPSSLSTRLLLAALITLSTWAPLLGQRTGGAVSGGKDEVHHDAAADPELEEIVRGAEAQAVLPERRQKVLSDGTTPLAVAAAAIVYAADNGASVLNMSFTTFRPGGVLAESRPSDPSACWSPSHS